MDGCSPQARGRVDFDTWKEKSFHRSITDSKVLQLRRSMCRVTGSRVED